MDFIIARFFNQLGQGTVTDVISVIISYNIIFIALFSLIGLVLLFHDKIKIKKFILALVIATSLHYAISDGFFKTVLPDYFGIERERPYLAHPQEISPLGNQVTSSSFPSNHMSSVVATLSVVAYYARKMWKFVLAFVALTALSRMHNGMHYPTDVIGGALLGFGYSALAVFVVEKYYSKIEKLISKKQV